MAAGYTVDARKQSRRGGHMGALVNTSTTTSMINCKFDTTCIGFFPVIIANRIIDQGEEFLVSYGKENLVEHHNM